MNADIDKLESNIKLINIWFMPLVVILLYIMIKLFTERQRKDFYKKIGRVEEKSIISMIPVQKTGAE